MRVASLVCGDEFTEREFRYLDQRFGVPRLPPELCRAHGPRPYAKDEQVHDYLASQFGTKFAVPPVTTKAERDLCRSALDEWQRSSGRQNTLPSAEGYMQTTRTVNEKADRQIIHYKHIDRVRRFFENDEKKRTNDTLTNLPPSSAMRRMAAGHWARSSIEVPFTSSGDPVVRNLGPPRPPEQPVKLMNIAASTQATRPAASCALTLFIGKERHSSDVH
ncbi:hypothetical protein BCR37DRAFT_394720 [Protomyces lactucae-debilis]|uniref:Uncharacterized protein n=1 Tax=Protomyces lactucae-debilis TaxID=2754530 RepID=A0A1Y2F301_PROLT|nr:uncharacterized protein BCR37DRAFT_394720 [Protomyces lactucae-debilis]ORY78223.1 hypothetical protein BCR37DRAFT_394720 [Protomyces lactucae-debilis]